MGAGRTKHPVGGTRLTQSHMEGVTDVNKIMDRFHKTGVLASGTRQSGRKPMFLNLTGQSYHEMLVQLQSVQGSFASLPAKVRKRFAHNPENLLTFLEDDKNLQEAMNLGLLEESDLSPERKAQMELFEQVPKDQYREFQEWRERQKAPRQEGGDPPEGEGMRADPEAQPSYAGIAKGGAAKRRRTS